MFDSVPPDLPPSLEPVRREREGVKWIFPLSRPWLMRRRQAAEPFEPSERR